MVGKRDQNIQIISLINTNKQINNNKIRQHDNFIITINMPNSDQV